MNYIIIRNMEAKSKTVSIRLSEKEYKKLKEYSIKSGIKMSDYIRHKALSRKLPRLIDNSDK